MSRLTLLKMLKEHAISQGYSLVAEDVESDDPEFFAPEMFLIADPAGATYRVVIENVAGSA